MPAASTEESSEEEDREPPPPATSRADEMIPPINRDPILLKTVPTEYPKEFAGTGVNAEVVVSMLVDRLGRASHVRVEGSPDPAFTEAALAALGQFEFLPALENGRITNAPLKLTLQVREDLGDSTLFDYEGGRIQLLSTSTVSKADSPARRLFGVRPAYPIEMLAAGKSGEVVLEFSVGEDGKARAVKVLESTYREFSHAVQGALALWKFSPAVRQGRPIVTALRYRVSFQAHEVSEEHRTMAKRLIAGETIEQLADARRIDGQARVVSKIDPMAPAREASDDRYRVRRANVAFIVDVSGNVLLPRILSSSDPVAGYTALAAVNYWKFEPARRGNQAVAVMVTMPFRF